MNIYKVTAAEEKKTIARQVLEALPEWFGIPQAREDGSPHRIVFYSIDIT